jgi:hypothetical protein
MGGVNVILIVRYQILYARSVDRRWQVEAIQEFVTHSGTELKPFHLASILAVAAAFGELSYSSYCSRRAQSFNSSDQALPILVLLCHPEIVFAGSGVMGRS